MTLSRKHLWLALILLGGPAALLTAVSMLLKSEPSPFFDTRRTEDVAAVWSSDAGGRLEFTRTGEFTASNIRLDPTCTDAYDAGRRNERFSGTGKWKFGSFPDEPSGVTLEFTPTSTAPDLHPCTVYSMFTGTPERPALQLQQDRRTPEEYTRGEPLGR
ncbi:hypothetical protein ACFWUW_15080 [Streptomyces sp. NPDC058655]|uniref:hypothetical protein n=1 Tax=Streptomyces sp. NPDC058655 TaxID=3346577 RepID=UPI003650A774